MLFHFTLMTLKLPLQLNFRKIGSGYFLSSDRTEKRVHLSHISNILCGFCLDCTSSWLQHMHETAHVYNLDGTSALIHYYVTLYKNANVDHSSPTQKRKKKKT